jgi:site-specific DNA-methyltransferase (adenine-specific)
MKPIELVEKAVNNSSRTNELVLDTFLGSGSTLIACEKTGRICYGMELDEHYCDVIRKRWAEYVHGKDCDWEKLTPKAG